MSASSALRTSLNEIETGRTDIILKCSSFRSFLPQKKKSNLTSSSFFTKRLKRSYQHISWFKCLHPLPLTTYWGKIVVSFLHCLNHTCTTLLLPDYQWRGKYIHRIECALFRDKAPKTPTPLLLPPFLSSSLSLSLSLSLSISLSLSLSLSLPLLPPPSLFSLEKGFILSHHANWKKITNSK